MDIKKLKDDLKEIYTEYNKIFESAKADNYKEICANLKPYEIKPDPKNIKAFKGESKAALSRNLAALRERGLNITDTALKEISAAKTEAPTQEAVNYISLLNARKNLTETDIDNAMEQYGSNFSCYKAIEDIANERRIPLNYSNNAEKIESTLLATQSAFNKIGVIDCENGHATAGAIAFQTMFLDEMPDK